MEKEIKLINQDILIKDKTSFDKEENTFIIDFKNYKKIEKILKKRKSNEKKLSIYDVTYIKDYKKKEIFLVNDHVNRIGYNPFIGKQKKYKIDFINIENLYLQTEGGVTTYCCGSQLNIDLPYPSSHLANIATLGKLLNYSIQGFLTTNL